MGKNVSVSPKVPDPQPGSFGADKGMEKVQKSEGEHEEGAEVTGTKGVGNYVMVEEATKKPSSLGVCLAETEGKSSKKEIQMTNCL